MVYLGPVKFDLKNPVLPWRVKCGGTEGEIVVVHGHLPSPAHDTARIDNKHMTEPWLYQVLMGSAYRSEHLWNNYSVTFFSEYKGKRIV